MKVVEGAPLPASWTSITLSGLAEIRLGRQRSPDKAHGPHMAPYLRAANVTWTGLDLSDVKHMAFTPNEQETYRLQTGDILLSEASGSAGEVGKPAIWSNEIDGCCFQNTLIRIRPPIGTSKFLYLQLLYLALSGRFIDSAKGVGIHHLGAERLSKIEVSLAPLAEQHRIAAAVDQHLSDIDAGVAALERALRNLKRYRASILKNACEGKLVLTEAELARKEGREYEPAAVLLERILTERRARWEAEQLAKMAAKGQVPKDDKWKARYEEPKGPETSQLAELPDGWVWTTVEQVAPLQAGFAFSSAGFAPSGARLLKGDNVRDGWLSESSLDFWPFEDAARYAAFVLREGDIVLAMDRPVYSSGSKATKVARLGCAWDGALLLQRVGCFRCIEARVRPHLFAFLRSESFRAHLITSQKGSQDGKDLPHVSGGVVNSAPFPLPPLAEQQRIITEVDRLLSIADETETVLRAQRKRAEVLRRAVLKAAFEGKLVPQDPSDEPASALLARLQVERASLENASKPVKRPARAGGRLSAEARAGGDGDG